MVKRNYNVGGDIQPRKDLTRYVRWPKYVNLQRKKQVLLKRLKVPPMINQFSNTLNKNQATELIKLVMFSLRLGALFRKRRVHMQRRRQPDVTTQPVI